MPPRVIQFIATTVDCSEAGDFEIVQVTFDTEEDGPEAHGSQERTSPYLLLSVNFEFEDDDDVRLEFHDGNDYDGGYGVTRAELWRDRVRVVAQGGPTFEIGFELSEKAFKELRKFLKMVFRTDCFRE